MFPTVEGKAAFCQGIFPIIRLFFHLGFCVASSNASLVRPCQRPDRQNEAETSPQTFMAGNYAKTTARGHGQHQAFVSRKTLYYKHIAFQTLLDKCEFCHHWTMI
jgi:hypothetical protein